MHFTTFHEEQLLPTETLSVLQSPVHLPALTSCSYQDAMLFWLQVIKIVNYYLSRYREMQRQKVHLIEPHMI